MLIDQGGADGFLQEQLGFDTFEATCDANGYPVTMRMQDGYDHSYYFISSFLAEHIAWHASKLTA
jgi:S-formylglutathione hydrolase